MKKGQRSEISYRYAADKHKVMASTPDKGIMGVLTADDPHNAMGVQTSLAFVHPDFRRQGVATTMYNILSHQVGYRPRQDSVRSPAGNAWAEKAGGHIENPGKVLMPKWDIPKEEVEENLPNIHSADWQRGEAIDPTVAKALTPYKRPRSRSKQPQPEQLHWEMP